LCWSSVQCGAVRLLCVAVFCSVLQCVAVCCSVLQGVACRYDKSYTYEVCVFVSKIMGLFCKGALQKRLYSAKETYNLKEPREDTQVSLLCVSLSLKWSAR